jgi:hypothetical protein
MAKATMAQPIAATVNAMPILCFIGEPFSAYPMGFQPFAEK